MLSSILTHVKDVVNCHNQPLHVMNTRENSFLNAITSAGITYAVTRACTMGNLMECSCDKSHPRSKLGSLENAPVELQKTTIGNLRQNVNYTRHKHESLFGGKGTKLLRNVKFPEGEWEWGGCSDNVQFGFRQSRIYLESRARRRSDLRNLVKKHNNKAGRLTIRDNMRLECKCHGLSGSCTVKTCWLKMPPFREVATRLRDQFDSAYKVVLRNDGNSFMPDCDSTKPPSKYDLVYTEDSPDFCLSNSRTGSLGTQDRICNATSTGVDGCDFLCCNRGYKHIIVSELVNCKCVFKWCCEVTCEKCMERREVNTCL